MQVVGYEPSATGSSLVLAEEGDVRRVALEPGVDLAYDLGERRCAGVLDEGGHCACDRPAAPYCEFHTSTWVCARCTGTCLKDEMDCYEDHAVYLAAFAPDTFKVGVTKRRRLETRLREQGADRAAHVHTVSNGRIARELEAEIAADVEITDRVRTDRKLESLARTVDVDAWEAFLEHFDVIERFSFDYGLDLECQPVGETIAAGRVRGLQGRLLILEVGGTCYGVDLRDLVGYELEAADDAMGRRLQASLGSFG